jgi:prepilin-type N-terminal cleavage/methylation domain-containing protein
MGKKRKMMRAGFSLVELAVVVVIIGVLAAFAVPRFRASVERSKAAEAFNYLAAVQAAQERYNARQSTYADDIDVLDIKLSTPKYFSVGSVSAGSTGDLEDSWSLSLTRSGASAGYGEYTVTFNEEGFDDEDSTIVDHPDINPMQT